MSVAHDAQNQVAEVQTQAGHVDRADDHADDDAADAHADGAAAALNRRLNDGFKIHAGILADPRHRDGHENGDNRGEQRRIARKHQPQQHDQRDEQMTALPEHLARMGDVLFGQTRKPQPLGFQMHGIQQGQIIQKRRNRRRQHDLRIADAHELRHNEADRAHDRRGKLTAGRSNRFNRRGKILFIARFFHQRDGDGSGRRHVGDCRAVDHAHQGRRDDRNLGGAAGRLPDQRQRDIVDELRKTAVLEECTEKHEYEDIRRRNARARSEDAVGIPDKGFDYALERKGTRSERAGDIPAPDREVGQEDERDNRKVSACPPRRFKGDNQADHADPYIRRIQASGRSDRVIAHEQITVAEYRRGNERDVPDRHDLAAAAFLFERRIQGKRQRQQEHDVRRAEFNRAERSEHVCPNLKHSPDEQHADQYLFHRADIHAQAAVRVLFFHKLLCFIVKLSLRSQLLGFLHILLR